jgi:ankyrin repeat protein
MVQLLFFLASQDSHLDVVECLLEEGVSMNQAMNNGFTPVLIATENGHFDLVDYLIDNGADLNLEMKDGKIPFS